MTPYEFFLYREGYQKRLDDDMGRSKFIAYVTYASVTAAAGATPRPYEEWETPVEEQGDPDKPLKEGREVDAAYKARMEAEMNKT